MSLSHRQKTESVMELGGLSLLSVTSLKGVGPKVEERLSRLNLHRVSDLLFHLPLRYEDRTKITPIANLAPGQRVLIEGKIKRVSILGRSRAQLVCQLEDGTGYILLRFFRFNAEQKKRFESGDVFVRCFGEIRQGFRGGLEMSHPEYRITEPDSTAFLSSSLTPIYPVTEGLAQTMIRKIITQAVDILQRYKTIVELLPEKVLQQYQLLDLYCALMIVHRPDAQADQQALQEGVHPAIKRLAFEELVAHQVSLQKVRQIISLQSAYALTGQGDLMTRFISSLPFALTAAQTRVDQEIAHDLAKPHPMLRLVQGDVGSGKTVVAALAVLRAVMSGRQAAVMAPTELLCEQHLQNFTHWFAPLGIKVGCLSGGMTSLDKKAVRSDILSGKIQVVIGTHALFQSDVEFQSLVLLVIDEQHRFGVHQRLALQNKGMMENCYPHQLIMTATPIPRTLAMSAYGDLDVSLIDELPPGRLPIKTILVNQDKREEIVERMRAHCLGGQQAYWVCTLVEESEALDCQAAEVVTESLTQVLAGVQVGLVHGRMKSIEKEAVMTSFKAGDIDLLVATTVVEVGVDVPEATLMVIENPERLGLAQLHQLRGRIGRGSQASFCVLMYQSPLSATAMQRLRVMRSTQDGFVLAEHDLEMRGPGEVLGTRQSGLVRLKIADLLRDQAMLADVKAAAAFLVAQYPLRVDVLLTRWVKDAEQWMRA